MSAVSPSKSELLERPVPQFRVLGETEVLRPKPNNVVFSFLFGILCVGVGFIAWAEWMGKASLVFGIILIAAGFMQVFSNMGTLEVDSVGIHIHSGVGKRTHPWETIEWIEESEVEVGLSKSKFVGIRLRDDGMQMGVLRSANRSSFGCEVSLGNLYRIPASELADLLQARLLKETPIPTQIQPRPMGAQQEPDEDPFNGDGIG